MIEKEKLKARDIPWYDPYLFTETQKIGSIQIKYIAYFLIVCAFFTVFIPGTYLMLGRLPIQPYKTPKIKNDEVA